MAKIINARVWQKIDSLEDWNANTLKLGPGEAAYIVSESGQPVNFKLGDGTKPFAELPFWIKYDQGAFVSLLPDGSLPTPSVEVAYTLQFVGDIMNVMYWDGSTWSVSDSIVLPKGDKGEQGEKGDKGEKGDSLPYSEWSAEDVDKLIEDVNVNAQRIPAITAGVLPTPPQSNMYMVVTDVGAYTYGGTTIGTNAEGYQTTFWWNGTSWSNNGSVKVQGDPAPADGSVAEGDTRAVSGGEVYSRLIEGIVIESVNSWSDGYFRTTGEEVIPPAPTYGMEKTPKFLLKEGQTLKYGINTYSVSAPAILISFNLDGTFKSVIKATTNADLNIYYQGEYTATEDVLISVSNNTALNLGVKYVRIEYVTNESINNINERIDNLGISDINNKLDLLENGGEIISPQQNKSFSLTSYYYYTNGAVSPTPYGHTRTPKFLLKKGEKLKYGINVYTIAGSIAILNTYTTDGVFKENILKPTTPTLASFLEGEYVATEDVLIGMSDYTEGAYGVAYAYIEEYTQIIVGLTEAVERIENLEEQINIVNPSDLEADSLYQRGLAKQNLSAVKKYGIIVAGQSNTEGRVPIAQAPSYITSNDNTVPNVMMWNNGTPKAFQPFKFGVNTGSGNGTSTLNLYAYDAIASYLLAQDKAQTIHLIKHALGGTAIDINGIYGGGYWTPYTEEITVGRKLIEELKTKVLTALESNPDLEINAILWHQGESDSPILASVKYYQNLKNVIAYIRGIVGNPKLPFIFGTITPISAQYSENVDNAFRDVFAEGDFVYMVDMSGGTLLDAYHFDAVSTDYLGTEMFNILKDL